MPKIYTSKTKGVWNKMAISLNNHETRITALENSSSSGSGVSANIGTGKVNLKIASNLSAYTALITASSGSEVPLIGIVTGSNSSGYMTIADIHNDGVFAIKIGTASDRNTYLIKNDNKSYTVSVTPLGGYSGSIALSSVSSVPAFYIKFTPWVYDQRTVTNGSNTTSIGTVYTSGAKTTSNTFVLKYSGKISSNDDNISVEVREGDNYHMATYLAINGRAIPDLTKKFTVTKKVNGGSARTDTYTVNSDGRFTVPEGSAMCFKGIANGAVVELSISIA